MTKKTVNVTCGLVNGLQINASQIHKGFMGQETRVPLGDIVVLKQGENPGIDKELYDAWLADNQQLSVVQAGLITAVDETSDEDDSASHEVAAEPSDKSGG